MKNHYSLLLFVWLLIQSLDGLAQSPGLVWQKSLGGSNNDVAYTSTVTPDGGHVIVVASDANKGDVLDNYKSVKLAAPTLTGLAATPNPVCVGSPVTFTATLGNVSGSYTFTLTNGSSTSIIGTKTTKAFSQSLTSSDSGSQSFTLLVSSGGQTATATTSLTVNPSGVTRLYVKANASGANTGLNWPDAFTDLQSALKYPCTGSLTEIWIARGVYYRGSSPFTMLPNVAIYGGFEGIETNLSQRPLINLSNPPSTTLTSQGPLGDFKYIIQSLGNLTSTAILDGAEITIPTSGSLSSGINNLSRAGQVCSPQFRNLLFRGYVNTGNAPTSNGLFVFNYAQLDGEVSPSFINCVFRDNQAGSYDSPAGQFYSYAVNNSVVRPQFVNCVIANHTGNSFLLNQPSGGQIQPAFINCSFLNLPAGISSNQSAPSNGGSIDFQFINCVLWNTGGANTFRTDGQPVTAQYSLLDQAITGYTSGPGNLTATSSPFVSASDLSLPNTSPAVNAGNPASVTVASAPYSATSLPSTDAAANHRIVGGRVDMGALEVQNPVAPCGSVVYVTQSGTGSQNGSSWANAFAGTSLQTAINTAATCGAQVWVAQGLYKPTTGTDRTISFSMKEGVSIYGGFVGNEAQLSQRPAVNPVTGPGGASQPSSSTLSGDIGTLGDEGQDSDNSFHLVYNSSTLTNRAVLDGFVLTLASASYDENGSGQGFGGAIFNSGSINSSSPSIRNCLFVKNFADDEGGAIYALSSSLTIDNCRFENNTGNLRGGAMAFSGGGSPVVRNSSFLNNFSFSNGGAFYLDGPVKLTVQNSTMRTNQSNSGGVLYTIDADGSRVEFMDCLMEGHTAGYGGVMNIQSDTDVILTRCQFLSNKATDGESGVAYIGQGSLTATDCLFKNNSATDEAGAIYCQGDSSKLTNCVFQDNSCQGIGGALSVNSPTTLINCSFIGNKAYQGGAIYCGNLTLTNCSFLANQADQGGAIYSEADNVQLVNSILWNNGGANSIVVFYGETLVAASYSLFEPGVTGYTDGGNNLTTTLTPFVSTTSTQLRDCSVAINTGSNQAYSGVSGPATDLAGNARQYNGGMIDRGAYEYQGNPTTLTVTNPAISTATVGQAFSQSFTASGGSGSYSFSVVSSNLPASLSLSSTGVLSGTPTVAGSYSVLVQASDASGCVGLASTAYSLTVTDATPTITGFAVAPNRVCVGSPITFTATIGNMAGSYSWSLENGGSPIGSPSPTTATAFSVVLTASGSGVQTFTLTVTSGGQRVTATTSLTVNALPIVGLTNNGPLSCTLTTVTLTASGGTSYTFANGSGTLGTPGSANTLVVNSPGTYSVTLANASGCVSTTTTTVTQQPDQTIAFTQQPASASSVTSGANVTTSVLISGNPISYQWYKDNLSNPVVNQTAATLNLTNVQLADAGSYSVVVTGSCNSLTSNAFSLWVTSPVTPLALTLTANPTQLLTDGATTLTATVSGGTPAYSYRFTGPGTITPTGNTATVSSLSAGVQTFQVLVTDATSPTAQTSTGSVSVTLSPANTPPTTMGIANQTATVGQGFNLDVASAFSDTQTPASLSFSASGLPTGLNLTGSVISGTPSATGVSSITVRATDPGSLSVSTSFTLTVYPAPVQPSGPFAITAVTIVSCTPILPNRFSISFTPRYDGLTGQPISFSVVNELLPTSEPGPYTLQLYTDNPVITLKATQTGTPTEASFSYNWLAACRTSEATNTPPTLVTPIANQTATAGTYFTFVIPDGTFTDAETPLSLKLSASGVPAGLGFSGATLSGVPSTTVGSPFSVTITATDPGNLSVSTPFLLTVLPATSTPPPTLPFAITGVTTISCTPVADRINITFAPNYVGLNGQPIAFEVTNEIMPTTDPAPYSLTLYRDNAILSLKAIQTGSVEQASFSYNWLAACASQGQDNTPPRVNSPVGNQTATVGQGFSLTLSHTFADQETPNGLTLTATGLPDGLSLTGTLISGTPSLTGVSTIVLTATDPGSLSASTSFVLTVSPASSTSVSPPPSDVFSITGVQTVSCEVLSAGQRRLTFTPLYAGLTDQPVSFSVVNELLPTTAPGPYVLNLYTDNPVITLKASQSGTAGEASFSYNWLGVCNASARLGAGDVGSGLQVRVLGNPVEGSVADVEISGVMGQAVQLEIVDMQGNAYHHQVLDEAGRVNRVSLPLGDRRGVLLIRVSSMSQQVTVKLIRL